MQSKRPPRNGIGQLSLVEHALCPLDGDRSLQTDFVHQCSYLFSNASGRRTNARVRIACPLGLSALDEFYLWGLLALTFAQPKPHVEFHATRHYCLRQLGVIDQHQRRGGRQYEQFSQALERLSAVTYQNDAFYDPIRCEHRRVSFGFLSYSLPLRPESSRAWRIVWDPIFFELVGGVGGHMRFDLNIYCDLDPASRRLFLLLSKIFRRRAVTPRFDLKYLGVQVLGYAPSLTTRDLKIKVIRCVNRMVEREIVKDAEAKTMFERKRAGSYGVQLRRGPYFDRSHTKHQKPAPIESPLVEQLQRIGVDAAAIPRLLRSYPIRLLQEWIDITLAAEENFGLSFFKRSPAAYFIDNVQNAAKGTRTPPDWWHGLRQAERRAQAQRARDNRAKLDDAQVVDSHDGDWFDHLVQALTQQFTAAGQPKDKARANGKEFAKACNSSEFAGDAEKRRRMLKTFS